MKLPGFVSRAMSLHEAAAVIFVLVALLPLLVFVAVSSLSGLLSRTETQFPATLLVYLGYAVDNARLIEEAHQSSRQHQTVVDSLGATQAQLVRGETLAAIGKLASGMAHHLNNLFVVMLGRLE